VPEARDAPAFSEGLIERLAQHNSDIFDEVVRITLYVTGSVHLEIDQAVPRELLKHVIEHPHAGLDIVVSGAIEVDLQIDLCLAGLALN
jgi:hypothetical protein